MKKVEKILVNNEELDYLTVLRHDAPNTNLTVVVDGVSYRGNDLKQLFSQTDILGLNNKYGVVRLCKYTNKDESFLDCIEEIKDMGYHHKYYDFLRKTYGYVKTLGIKVHKEPLTDKTILTLSVSNIKILQEGAVIVIDGNINTLRNFVETILGAYKVIDCDIYFQDISTKHIYQIVYNPKFVSWFTKRSVFRNAKN